MKSTDPSAKEFVPEDEAGDRIGSKRTKRQIWEKGLKSFAEDFEFANLSFDNEDEENKAATDSKVAIINIKLDRRLRGTKEFDKIEEITRLKKSPSGVWQYLGSEMTNKGSLKFPAPPKKMVTTNKPGVPKGN